MHCMNKFSSAFSIYKESFCMGRIFISFPRNGHDLLIMANTFFMSRNWVPLSSLCTNYGLIIHSHAVAAGTFALRDWNFAGRDFYSGPRNGGNAACRDASRNAWSGSGAGLWVNFFFSPSMKWVLEVSVHIFPLYNGSCSRGQFHAFTVVKSTKREKVFIQAKFQTRDVWLMFAPLRDARTQPTRELGILLASGYPDTSYWSWWF